MGCRGAVLQPARGARLGRGLLAAGGSLALPLLPFTSSLSNYLFNSEGGLIK